MDNVTLGESFIVDPWNDIKYPSYKCLQTVIQFNTDVFAINITEISRTTVSNVPDYNGGYFTDGGYYCKYRIDTHKTGEYRFVIRVQSFCKPDIKTLKEDDCYVNYHITVSPKPVLVESISFDVNNVELNVGDKRVISASVSPSNAADKSLTWSTDNKTVATVDASGVVEAKAPGQAVITAKANDGSGKTAKCVVTVKAATVSVTSVTLNKTTAELEVGKTLTLTATVAPSNATNKALTWSSSNTSVATVDGNGKVTAVSAGKATITAKAKDGSNKSATCAMTVKASATDPNISFVSVSCNNTNLTDLTPNDNLKFHAVFKNSGKTYNVSTYLGIMNKEKTKILYQSSTDTREFPSNGQVAIDYNYSLKDVAEGEYYATVFYSRNWGDGKGVYSGNYLIEIKVKNSVISVTSVTLNKTTAELEVGKTLTLTATVAPSNATNKALEWSSSNKSIATVDGNGKVTAVAAGNATITAKAKDGSNKSATCTVTVKAATVSVTSVTLNKTTAELEVGKTLTLTATVAPSNATNKALTWSSSNTSVATVDANGKVTAVAAGNATITAKAKDGSNKSATCAVTVKAATVSVTSVTLNKTTAELEVGGTLTLTATVSPSNATNKALEWSSSNKSIATVDGNGKVTAVAAGNATITAKAKDGSNKSATCAVTVKAATVSVTSVTLNKTTAELEVGGTLTLTATVSPSNATNKALDWSSSNKSVATVEANGKVTAVAAGKATIMAKAKDGSNKSATCSVTVKASSDGSQPKFETLVLWHANGKTTEISLSKKPQIQFAPDKVLVKGAGINFEYPLSDIVKFTYKKEDIINDIDNPTNQADFTRDNERIVFTGIKSTDEVALYKLNGSRVDIQLKAVDDSLVLPLNSIPQGIYLLRINNQTFKIIKK